MHAVIRVLVILMLSGLLVGGSQTTASADSCPPGEAPTPLPAGGVICIPATDPGTPGGPGDEGPANGGGGGGGGGPQQCQDYTGAVIPCSTEDGVWFASQQCYATQSTPQPGPDSPAWAGNDPASGAIWSCNAPFNLGLGFYVATGDAPAVIVDPAVLAQRALDQLQLATPEIHMAPQPPAMTYVGLETWLWMGEAQWDELSLTVTAGATSVTVVAKPVEAAWDLTAGSTTCTSAGREWVTGRMSSSDHTDCSYTFSDVSSGRSGGTFPVSVAITYQADWTCSGTCLAAGGTLGEVDGPTAQDAIRVGERQSVIVTGR